MVQSVSTAIDSILVEWSPLAKLDIADVPALEAELIRMYADNLTIYSGVKRNPRQDYCGCEVRVTQLFSFRMRFIASRSNVLVTAVEFDLGDKGKRQPLPAKRKSPPQPTPKLLATDLTPKQGATARIAEPIGYLITWHLEDRRQSSLQQGASTLWFLSQLRGGFIQLFRSALLRQFSCASGICAVDTRLGSLTSMAGTLKQLGKSGYRTTLRAICTDADLFQATITDALSLELENNISNVSMERPLPLGDLRAATASRPGISLDDAEYESASRSRVICGYLSTDKHDQPPVQQASREHRRWRLVLVPKRQPLPKALVALRDALDIRCEDQARSSQEYVIRKKRNSGVIRLLKHWLLLVTCSWYNADQRRSR